MTAWLRVIVLILSVGMLGSCGGGGGSNRTIQSITVSPSQATVVAGLTQQFSASAKYSDGSMSAAIGVTWSSQDASIATVDGNGLATTHVKGVTSIVATLGSVSSSASLSVSPAVPVSLSISPASSTVLIGTSAPTTLTALLIFTDGSSQDVSASASWSLENSFTASIDSSGNVSPLRTGYTTVSCTSGSFSATAAFVVIAEPRYLYFMSETGRLASKAVIDSTSGQLRMMGYIPTGANNYAAFHCPTMDPANKFLYVGSAINGGPGGEIQIYDIDPVKGGLAALAGSPFSQSAPVDCLEFEPTGKFAYAASATNSAGQLLTYSADSVTGALTLLNSTNLTGVLSRVAMDPLGKYLYVVTFSNNYLQADATGYVIDSSTGALTPIPGTPFPLSNIAGAFSFHPSGNYVYLADTNGAAIDTYSINRATGALTSAGTLATCINPSIVRFSPDGRMAYTACSMDSAHDPHSASVDSFSVAVDGSLTHLSTAPSDDGPLDLTIDPSGKFLYLAEVHPYIHLFQVGADGSATSALRFGVQPNSGMTMAIVQGTSAVKYTAKAAYVVSTGDNNLLTYDVKADGTLSLPTSTIPIQNAFFSLSLWPWGTDIAMASAIPSPNLLAFPLSADGSIATSGFLFGNATSGGGVAIDPSGQFAFVSDSSQGVIYTYGRSAAGWGLFTYQPPPPASPYTTFAAGAGAGPIVTDASGLLVYVANQGDNTISAYQYWGTDAELFESKGQFVSPYSDGSPFAIGATPISMAIDPNETFLYVLCGDRSLRTFAIDYYSGGHLAQIGSITLSGQPSGLTVEPTGKYVYASDSTGVSAFSVNRSSGALSAVRLSPTISQSNITGVYAEPSGHYLYVSTGASNVAGAVFGYSIGSDGNLTAISAQPLATPKLPSSMVVSADIQ
ncbi:MAG TPA: beta-propeller fold lactonase family protein [Candidatus Binatia bacterium]|nr:beta-propeller fold lactonase family protein [Candidatus Binatia bacterium]